MTFTRDPGAMSSKGLLGQVKKLSFEKPLESFKLLRDMLRLTYIL